MVEEVLMTPREVARLLRSGVSTLYRLLSEGKIPPPLRIGRKTYWRREELLNWLSAGAPRPEHWRALQAPSGKKADYRS